MFNCFIAIFTAFYAKIEFCFLNLPPQYLKQFSLKIHYSK